MGRAARHFAQSLARAVAALERRPLSDEAVHTARKALKKARAALRLLRPAIGEAAFRSRNARLRDAARYLAPLRHVTTLLDALAALRKRHPAKFRGAAAPLADRLARRLRARREQLRREISAARALDGWLRKLELLRKRAAAAQGVPDQPDGPAAGLRRIYRAGRNALARAREKPSDEALHEWRKQVKYLSNALAILGPDAMEGATLAARVARLAERLGEQHDLSELAPLLPSRSALRQLVDERRERLAQRSLEAGHILYRDKPRRFASWLR